MENSISTDEALCQLYEDLRRLANSMICEEYSGMTLQPTALVHEAYMRLKANNNQKLQWQNKAHFFGSVAISMRRILVEAARRKKTIKHGGLLSRISLDVLVQPESGNAIEILAVDEAMTRFEHVDQEAVALVNLRYFMGMTINEAAEVLEISPRSADRLWAFAKAWLRREISHVAD